MTKADFDERKSKLKRALVDALGAAALPYLITGAGRNPKRYALMLPPQAIGFVASRWRTGDRAPVHAPKNAQ